MEERFKQHFEIIIRYLETGSYDSIRDALALGLNPYRSRNYLWEVAFRKRCAEILRELIESMEQ